MGAGSLVEVADADSRVHLTLDADGRVTGSHQAYGTLGYEYDAAGRRTRTTSGARTIGYGYDALDRLTGLTDASGRQYSFTYDLAGRLTRRTLPNQTTTTYQYDDADQLGDLLHTSTAGGSLADNVYVHDAAGQIEGWGTPDGNTRTFAYDPNGRLTAANSSLPSVPNEAFAYDLMGNWTPYDGRVHDEANQLTEDNGFTYRYDADGNLIEKRSKSSPAEVTTYRWDPRNRLIRVTTPAHTLSYRYDGFGRRIARSVDGAETRYVLDDQNVIEERDAAGALKASNVHAGLDVLLAREDASLGTTWWAHADHLGSIQALTDASGSAIERYRYTAFGQPTVLAADGSAIAAAVRQPFAFTAREWEPEAALSFHRARFLDPVLGRWISRDPIGENGRINLYIYVANEPQRHSDPTGLDIYFGGSREESGHFWVAVDRNGSQVIRYDYGARGYNGAGGYSSGPVGAFVSTLSTEGQASIHAFSDIITAAGGNEYYRFEQTSEADAEVFDRMLLDTLFPPQYVLLHNNCIDGSAIVAGYPGTRGRCRTTSSGAG
jgi:RHS repeat-associated protein